jgi:hypothetical protein
MSYGCHNQPRPTAATSYPAQFGYEMSYGRRVPRYRLVPHVMTTACQYTNQHATDPGCAGCKHKSNKEPS